MASEESDRVQGMARVTMVDDAPQIHHYQSQGDHAFLMVTFENGVRVRISTNLAEMIGGAGSGLRQHQEDIGRREPSMPDERLAVALNGVIAAWVQLEEGDRSIRAVSGWLNARMLPAINNARKVLGLPIPREKDRG